MTIHEDDRKNIQAPKKTKTQQQNLNQTKQRMTKMEN